MDQADLITFYYEVRGPPHFIDSENVYLLIMLVKPEIELMTTSGALR